MDGLEKIDSIISKTRFPIVGFDADPAEYVQSFLPEALRTNPFCLGKKLFSKPTMLIRLRGALPKRCLTAEHPKLSDDHALFCLKLRPMWIDHVTQAQITNKNILQAVF